MTVLGGGNESWLRQEAVKVTLQFLACTAGWVALQSLNTGTLVWGHFEGAGTIPLSLTWAFRV